MMPLSVKVCGVTNVHDAQRATECGATHLGLIFVASSPRWVTPDSARELGNWQRKKTMPLVGVFKDPSAEEVKHAIDTAKISLVQLHGKESVEFCRDLAGEHRLPLIKTIEIDPAVVDPLASLREQIARYAPVAQYFLFDKPKNSHDDAGTNWLATAMALLKQATPFPLPYFFAGGLNAGNVAAVISELQPFGVDVASGIESRPGVKDLEKMQDFFQAAHRHNAASEGVRS